MLIVTQTCPFCGKVSEVAVNPSEYADYENGKLAQDAFPNLSATEREILISGICPQCQDDIFGTDEEV